MPVQPDDPRLYIGASVEAKAVFVTSLAECTRRYGTNAKTKVVPGLVMSFGQDSAPPGRTRAITFIVADFYFGDNVVKRGKLNIRSVKSVECSALHEELKVILQQRENPIITTSPAHVAQAAALHQEQQSPQVAPAGDDDGSRSASTPFSVSTTRTPVGATTTTPTTEAAVTQQNRDKSPASLTFHNTQWFESDQSLLEQEINGPVVRRLLSIRNRVCGTLLEQDCDRGATMSRLDNVPCMFPPRSVALVNCSADITTA